MPLTLAQQYFDIALAMGGLVGVLTLLSVALYFVIRKPTQ